MIKRNSYPGFVRNTVFGIGLFAAMAPGAFAAPVGSVEFATGPARIVNASGERAAKKGDALEVGDMLSTGKGRVQVRFTDGGFVSLQPETEFRVDEYNFNGKADGTEKSAFSFVKGALRTITGLIGKSNKDAYVVKTPVATIGIRGTGYTGESDGVSLKAAVFDGKIFLRNRAGELEVTRGNAAVVLNANTAPRLTYDRPRAGPNQVERSAKKNQNQGGSGSGNSGGEGESEKPVFSSPENVAKNSIPIVLADAIANKLGVSLDVVLNSNVSTILAAQGGDNVVDNSGQNVSQGTDIPGQTLIFSRQNSPASPGAVNVTDGNQLCGTGCTDYHHSDVQNHYNVTARYSDANTTRTLQFAMQGDDFGMVRNLGTAKNTNAGRDAYIAWGRWERNSALAESEWFFTCSGCHVQTNLSANNGFNYVVGTPTSVMQTGKAVYNLLGYSVPSSTSTLSKWAGGSVTGAKLIANLDRGMIDGYIDLLFPALGNSYRIHALNMQRYDASNFAGSGGSTLHPGWYSPNAFVTSSGSVADCAPTCNAWVLGFFAGDPPASATTPSREGAQRAGMVYTFNSQLDTATASCGNADFVGQNGSSTAMSPGACVGGSVVLSKVAAGAGVSGLRFAGTSSVAGMTNPELGTSAVAYFDAANSGKMTVIDNGGLSYSMGSATGQDHGSNTDMTWGRWVNGFMAISGAATTTADLRATNMATHGIVGVPATNVPTTGSATYSLLDATTPSADSTSSAYSGGSVRSSGSSLTVNFANSTVDTNLQIRLPNFGGSGNQGTFNIQSTGQALAAGNYNWSASGNLTTGTNAASATCADGCSTQIVGFLSGNAARSAGVAYNFSTGVANVQGVAAFSKN